jgi:peptidoglycan-N-acetylglucosamine deacetylase
MHMPNRAFRPLLRLNLWQLLPLLLPLLLLSAVAQAQAQSLALTFDDGLDPDKEPRATAWNAAILATLRREGIQAMHFPSLRHVGDGAGRDLVKQWSLQGHLIGNHTSEHRSLNSKKLSAEEFIGHVMAADRAFGALPGWQRLLRFPYLKEGDTADKRDAVRAWMRNHHYLPAPVSIDASDWHYDDAYLKFDEALRPKLKRAYMAHLLDRAAYYNRLAKDTLGREPAHVLLLHTNAINAAWLADVIAAFRTAGWTIVAPTVAFADPLYRVQPKSLPAGEGIVWALAKDAGRTDLRYPAEDAEYEEPIIRQIKP